MRRLIPFRILQLKFLSKLTKLTKKVGNSSGCGAAHFELLEFILFFSLSLVVISRKEGERATLLPSSFPEVTCTANGTCCAVFLLFGNSQHFLSPMQITMQFCKAQDYYRVSYETYTTFISQGMLLKLLNFSI